MELLIILLLILLNGIFAMSEMALVSARKFKLEQSKNKGNAGAKTALELSDNPTKFLSTVQIGITLIGILLGVYSGENLTNDAAVFINQIPFLAPYAKPIATGLIVVLVTYLSIVMGELLPKRIGMTFPETIISTVSRPMRVLSLLTSPFVWLLTSSNNLLLKILGIKSKDNGIVSEEEIKSLIKESTEGGEIQEIEQDIVHRVFELGDRKVKSIYTHKSDIVFFNNNDTLTDILPKIKSEKHSAYPVVENNNLDKVIGIVLLKDLFDMIGSESSFDITHYVRTPLFINENMDSFRVLELFKNEKIHYAIVLDEYGSTEGIVTMDDLMDALVGDTSELGQEEYQITARTDNSWLVDGQFSLTEFIKAFDLDIDEEVLENYSTVAGLFMHYQDSIPKVGDIIKIDNLSLEVVDKDGQRIDKILVMTNDN